MTNQDKITNIIENFKKEAMNVSSQESGAYFAYCAMESGESGLTFGGRMDVSGSMMAETLAHLVFITPGVDESFIDTVFAVSKQIYREMLEGYGGLQ